MQRFLLTLTLFTVMLLSACSKSKPMLTSSLDGTWQLLRSVGGIGGYTYTYGITEIHTLRLKKDSTYEVSLNGALETSGVYTLRMVTTPGVTDNLLIMTDNVNHIPWQYAWSISASNLYLSNYDISDGYSNTYIKVAQ